MNPTEPNYKDTISLPQTEFPMRGSLPKTEPIRLESWKTNEIYKKIQKKNEKGQKFVMPDGPPYANGDLHVGHALNKILKDMVLKFQSMKGRNAAFVPGWDCHGLPIELKVTKALGDKAKTMDPSELRAHCRKEALTWVDKQSDQFQRMGVLADWENPYLTLHPSYEAAEVRVLAKILRRGLLFRGEKPVYWSPDLRTAFAAAEVEYKDHVSPSIYVKFDLPSDQSQKILGLDSAAFVIWTTTPWTIPANTGICLHPDFEYGVYSAELPSGKKENLIVGLDLKEVVEKETELQLGEALKTFKGSELEGIKARHPFLDRDSLVINGGHVTKEAGTGCVHTAPGHGMDDYVVGLKYKLPVISPVDAGGKYTEEFAEMKGEFIFKANPKLIEKMKASGHLLHHKDFTHSYPHNPRTKKPLIFRATPQWFIRMEDKEIPLRKMALEATEGQIEFYPKWGGQRLRGMLSNAPDWCISRQRHWGTPIPVFYCQSCQESLIDANLMDQIADQMEASKRGIDYYFDSEVSDLIGDRKCSKCDSADFDKGTDILDVWFDSGVCHAAVQRERGELDFPADIYLEGSDQHRGWFQTSLVSSLAATGEVPYKALVTHGFVMDAQGSKMSKSLGNVIDPAKVIERFGAEILRLWVSHEDYGDDVTVGEEMFKRVSDTYRRFRNTMRFLLGNIHDFDPEKDLVPFKELPSLDRFALTRLNQALAQVNEAYSCYEFYRVYHTINHLMTVDLSSFYLDVTKDRLYTWAKTGNPRRSSQTVMYHLLTHLSKVLAPLTSFLSEETYQYIPGKKHESVFLESFPEVHPDWNDPELVTDFEQILKVRSETSKILEELRREKTIGSSLDASVTLTLPANDFEVLKKYETELRELFIVSQLTLKPGESLKIEAVKAEGKKCLRCWHYSTEIEETKPEVQFPGICPKCIEALS